MPNYSSSQKNAEFFSKELEAFAKLDFAEILKQEGFKEVNPELRKTNQRSFVHKGTQVDIINLKGNLQDVIIDGKRPFIGSGSEFYSGPSASGSQVDANQHYQHAARVSDVLAGNVIENPDQALRSVKALMSLFTKDVSALRKELQPAERDLVNRRIPVTREAVIALNPALKKVYQQIDQARFYPIQVMRKHAFKQASAEYTNLLNAYPDQAAMIAKTDLAKDTKSEQVLDKVLKEETYARLERQKMNDMFVPILVEMGYKPQTIKGSVAPEVIQNIKKQVDMVALIEEAVGRKARVEKDENQKFQYYAWDCPFSKDGVTEIRLTGSRGNWYSTNENIQAPNENGIKDAIAFVQMTKKLGFMESVEFLASKIAQPLKENQYTKEPAYVKNGDMVLIKRVPETNTVKYLQVGTKEERDAGKKITASGDILDFLERKANMTPEQATAYIFKKISSKWITEEKEGFYEHAVSLPGGREALKQGGTLLHAIHSDLEKAKDQVISDIKEVAERHKVSISGDSPVTTAINPGHRQQISR